MTETDKIVQFVDKNWDQIQKDMADLIAIPSVKDAANASDEAPFGPGPRRALDQVLKTARSLGLETHPCDGYCGIADLKGEDDQEIAMVTHVDVVPVSDTWNTDPFQLVVKDGWMLGRGIQDDKGPSILGLWAAAYFIKNDIKPKHTIRFIFGSDEESGMAAVKKYVTENPQPDFMITADAEFPVISGEKGIIHGVCTMELPEGSAIRSIKAGVAGNVVPASAQAQVMVGDDQLEAAPFIQIDQAGDGIATISASGISGHASTPEGTRNAIKVLMDYLSQHDLLSPVDEHWAKFVRTLVADSYGDALGIACKDDFLGELTCVGSMLNSKDGVLTQAIDIRYPTATTLEQLQSAIETQLGQAGTFNPGHTENFHVVDPASEPVQALMESYGLLTGEHKEPVAIGGGTYAKRFQKGVAFGPVELERELPPWVGAIHADNEGMSIAEAKLALAIYITALLRLQDIDLRA